MPTAAPAPTTDHAPAPYDFGLDMTQTPVARLLRPADLLLRRLSTRAQALVLVASAILGLALAHWGDGVAAGLGALQFACVVAAVTTRLEGSLAALRGQLHAVHQGDLTRDIGAAEQAALASLDLDVTPLAQQLSRVVARIRSESQYIAMSSDESVRHARALSERTESQAANLEQTRAGLASLLETVRGNGEQMRTADARSAAVRTEAEGVQQAVQASVDSLQRLEQRSRRMADIVTTIDSIAFQTNILALNAAVEAARAGESGRGFAVVAAEVRTLAQRSAQAAAEVKELIQGSIEEVDVGVRSVANSREALGRAVDGIREVSERLGSAARSSEEQHIALEEIAAAVVSLDELTQQNAQLAETTVSAAHALGSRAARLSDGVKGLHLRQGCADEARTMAQRASKAIDSLGIDEAVRRFHDPKGEFRDRDLYIVVADRADYFRAFGSDPKKAGKLRKDALPGDNQAAIRDASWRAVEAGGGWIEFQAPHPVTKQPVDKMGYIAPAGGGAFAVQCSVNRGDGASGGSAW
jgi:methyl-accepting chemotaxis protein